MRLALLYQGEYLESYGTPEKTSVGIRVICYHDFSTDNLPTCF